MKMRIRRGKKLKCKRLRKKGRAKMKKNKDNKKVMKNEIISEIR